MRGLVLLVIVSLTGCRSRKADLGMSDSAFVQIMSDLKVVADYPNLTPAARAQRREAVFRKRGVTAAQIEKLDATLAAHPNHAKLLWAAIEQKAVKETPKNLR
jgi:hypothetical protein